MKNTDTFELDKQPTLKAVMANIMGQEVSVTHRGMPEGNSEAHYSGNPCDDPPGNHPGEGTPFEQGGSPDLQWQPGPLPSSDSRDLKGTAPAIFDGNRKNMEQFMQEFTLYQMINQESPIMKYAYTCTTLALSFMRGAAIDDWVLRQTDQLYVRCNGDALGGITSMCHMDDECLWAKFNQDFQRAFTDTASEQRAYGDLTNYTMGNKSIDEYIAQFKHLLQKVGWDCTSRGSLFQFKKGLKQQVHLKVHQC